MDKKQQQYSRQGSSKALSSDSRKSSDVHSNKPWPRNVRRRENPNFSTLKNDTQRSNKVGPAKTRPNVDKRPKARGGPLPIGNGHSQFEDVPSASTGLASDDNLQFEISASGCSNHVQYELNSVYAAGSKKQNLNHLLNFHYGPREFDNYSGLNVFGKNGNNRSHVKKQKYNKEQFLQANFQFVVNWKAKPKITLSPDTLIDWHLIEQINIQTTEEPQCPICLYPPVAAKLTRCGHAYCWPCILHYLALTDKTWRKCPICYDAIHTNDLKSTLIVQQNNFCVGDNINLQLMQRKKGSLFIEKYPSSHSTEEFPLYSADDDESKFAKFLVAKRSDILSIIDREQKELETCNTEDNCPEFVFTQQALDLLKERKEGICKESSSNIEHSLSENLSQNLENINLKKPNATFDGKELETIKVIEECEQNAKYYYFYQSVDGQNIFLHPLNVKMLQACYGSLDQAPQLINAKILQIEHHSMDEDHRRRFTCLGHLPLTCNFQVVEVHLEPPVVTEDIMSLFKDDIHQRRKARMRRDREERRREMHINAINDRQMGKLIANTALINLSSSHEFPTWGFEDSLSFLSDSSTSIPIDVPQQATTSKRNTYSSVANSVGSPKAEFWPSLGEPSSSLNDSKEVTWGKSVHSVHPNIKSERYSESDSLNEYGEEFHPQPNLGEVLAEAISQKHTNVVDKTEHLNGKKKNKKSKKMLLFSTGMNYSGK